MRVLILGADGYLGWPTTMYFSERGHEVLAVDNYFRRKAATELDCTSLVLGPELDAKARLWQELTSKKVTTRVGDVADYAFLSGVFQEFSPDVVVHYAEQPSAVYSMMDRDKAAVTLQNNLITTLNVIYAVKEFAPDCHIIKLGTMGEYGTPDIDIEEGWLDIKHNGRSDKFLFPRQGGSLYHTTKIQDTDMLWLYVRTWGLRVTDLMQGPVYGISTDETDKDERLLPNFHYDEVFGTVINRFVVQSVIGYPLTVYGSGHQIRGYLNLRDTMQCVYLAAQTPASEGELRVYNQMTETFSVNELASLIKAAGDGLGYNVEIARIENPRVEKEEHYYNPKYTGLAELGLKPHLLTTEVLEGMFRMVERYKDKINTDAIFRGVKWK